MEQIYNLAKHQETIKDHIDSCFLSSDRGALILCGVGVGKTFPAIKSLEESANACLVVIPAYLMGNWKREWIKFSSGIKPMVLLEGTRTHKLKILSEIEKSGIKPVIVCSYNTFSPSSNFSIKDGETSQEYEARMKVSYSKNREVLGELMKIDFDIVLLDEAHYAKSTKSTVHKNLFRFMSRPKIKSKIAMTGTLIANGLHDAFAVCKLVCPSIFGVYKNAFDREYTVYKLVRIGRNMIPVVDRFINVDKFSEKLSSVSIRMNIDDVVDIPDAVKTEVLFELSKTESDCYKQMKKTGTFPDSLYMATNPLAKLEKLKQIMSGFFIDDTGKVINIGSSLVDKIFELCLELLQDKKKPTIWYVHDHVRDKIKKELSMFGIQVFVIDGDAKERQLILDEFKDRDKSVLLISLRICAGMNIPFSTAVIFAEVNHSKINIDQAEGRHRRLEGSSNGAVHYIYPVAEGTIYRSILDSLKNKDINAEEAYKLVTRKDGG